MNYRIRIILIILLLTVQNIYAGETIRLATGDWPPYTSQYDPDSKILERIVAEAFRLEGIEVKYDYFPWKRSFIYARDGDYDGTFPWVMTPERKDKFYMNRIPLLKDKNVFFHLKSMRFDWKRLDDLKKYRIGVTIGYYQEGIYKENGIKAEAASSEESNFRKLLAGRIDVYETSNIVGYIRLKKLFPPEVVKQFTHHPKAARVNYYYIFFSKKSPEGKRFSEKFDSGLMKLKASGEYERIISGEK